MDYLKIQELLLELLPQWNYKIAKPFKQLQDEGVSLEMYYCIKTLQWGGGIMTMSELGRYTKMPKQQMTKMVNRLVEQKFVERVYDPSDRRIIKIHLTDTAQNYLDHFIEYDASCFRPLLDQMSEADLARFQTVLEQLLDVFSRLPCECCDIQDPNARAVTERSSNMEELKSILEKFVASGWDLIAVPAQAWLDGTTDRDALISAIKQADQECGSCDCDLDPLYQRALELL